MVVEEDLAFGGGPRRQQTDEVSQNCTLGTYINLLTIVTLINLVQKEQIEKKTNYIYQDYVCK